MSLKQLRIMDRAALASGLEARFVRARSDSNTGRRSRGPVSAKTGRSAEGALSRKASGGMAEVICGVVPDGKTCDGLSEMRIRARACAASGGMMGCAGVL